MTRLTEEITVPFPSAYTLYNGSLYFAGDFTSHGEELWAYDLDTNELSLAANVRPGSDSSSPSDLQVYDGRLFFSAITQEYGRELWVYDDATGEATLAADVPLPRSSWHSELYVFEDQLFFNAETLEYGRELWSYDAATGEAQLVVDIVPGSEGSNPRSFRGFDGKLFMVATSTDNVWAYDFETEEVISVSGIRPFGGYHPYNGKLYFSASAYAGGVSVGLELVSLSPSPVASEATAETQPTRLHSPHPNPTQTGATVAFDLAKASLARVEVFDVLGRRVALLADEVFTAGEHTLPWQPGALPSGVYVVRLTAGDIVRTQRLTLVR